MKISVIVPVYNEEEAVSRCLDALLNQDYPLEDYEIIVVNDGSTDGTQEVVEGYPVRLINLERNMGRIIARETGSLAARYDMLYLVDSRVIPDHDVLSAFARIEYQPNIGGDHHLDKYRSAFDTFFYLLRRKVYRPYYPQFLYKEGKEYYYIDEVNFDKVPKGMSSVFISKDLFLSAIPENKGKMVNDDTRLLREVVKRRKILRHSDIKVTYLQRTRFWDVVRHMYERGPRFADYYLTESWKHKTVCFAMLFCVISLILSGVLYPELFFYASVTINTIFAIYFAEDLKDLFIVSTCLPPIAIAFMLGLFKGLFLDKWASV